MVAIALLSVLQWPQSADRKGPDNCPWGNEPSASMNDYEILRVIDFIERTRQPFVQIMPVSDEEPVWNIIAFLVKSGIKGQLVTASTLAQLSRTPYSTSRRLITRLIDEGHIVRVPRSRTGKTFSLHPSPAVTKAFIDYAGQIKALLAETMGMRPSEEDEDEYYFGGTAHLSPITPPLSLVQKRYSENVELKFLLCDDNYFIAMRNMWADFRNNLASRRNFDQLPLPQLYQRAIENAGQRVSAYDVITVNMPWVGEFASEGLIRPIGDLLQRSGVNPLDFHHVIWRTGVWNGMEYGVPIYCTIHMLAARHDLFVEKGVPFPRTFDEVVAAGRAFHQPEHGRYGIVWDGERGMPVAHSFMFFMGACGSPIVSLRQIRQAFTLEGTRPEDLIPLVQSDAGRATLDYMHRLIDISPPNILDSAWDKSLEVFLSGHSAMAYCQTMRAARYEYDVQSVVRRRVEYLPHPAGPGGGSRDSPIGGYILAVPSNLPQERVELAVEAIAWMTSRQAMKAHVKNGFPIAPRFSVSADPEAAASSPIVRFVDKLAKRNLLHTWQRPPLPQYTAIERVLGEEIHDALIGAKSDGAALRDASNRIERILQGQKRATAIDAGAVEAPPTQPAGDHPYPGDARRPHRSRQPMPTSGAVSD
jgi:multiple sugar transport system substrate-binding protein